MQSTTRLSLLAVLAILCALAFSAPRLAQASAPQGSLYFPAPQNTRWKVAAGYNSGTHNKNGAQYALDFARTDGASGGTPVLMPIAGDFVYYDSSPGNGCLAFDTSAGRLLLCHVQPSRTFRAGESVATGTQLGTISRASENGFESIEHIHIQLYQPANPDTAANAANRVPIPFSGSVSLDGWSFGCTSCQNWPAGWDGMVSHNPGVTQSQIQGSFAWASCQESDGLAPRFVNDGSDSMRWSSCWSSNGASGQYIAVDVGRTISVSRMSVNQETAACRSLSLYTWNGSGWTWLAGTSSGSPGLQSFSFGTASGRWFLLYCWERWSQAYGNFSVWEWRLW